MSQIYEHQILERQILEFASGRIDEIDFQIEQLQLEKVLMADILDTYKLRVCPDCLGEGHIMKPIPGCECDGPRMHACEVCKGKGKIN